MLGGYRWPLTRGRLTTNFGPTGGATWVVDGERFDWSKGDLLLLPLRPGGVEHQHFNLEEGKGCRWIAFSYQPVSIHVASELTQLKESPQFNQG